MIDKILGAIVGFGAASMFSKKSFAKGGKVKRFIVHKDEAYDGEKRRIVTII